MPTEREALELAIGVINTRSNNVVDLSLHTTSDGEYVIYDSIKNILISKGSTETCVEALKRVIFLVNEINKLNLAKEKELLMLEKEKATIH